MTIPPALFIFKLFFSLFEVTAIVTITALFLSLAAAGGHMHEAEAKAEEEGANEHKKEGALGYCHFIFLKAFYIVV